MSKQRTDRSAQITIRLDPKIMAGLHELASRIGIAPTTVAGMAIGEYVAKNQAVFQQQATMMESMGKEMARVIGGPFGAIFEAKSVEELKALFSDDESPEKQVDWTEAHHD
jgi:predicted transcriptional regulator